MNVQCECILLFHMFCLDVLPKGRKRQSQILAVVMRGLMFWKRLFITLMVRADKIENLKVMKKAI